MRKQLQIRARQAARICGRPVYIFRELMQLLAEHRSVAPGYSFLQDLVGQALTYEQDRLIGLVHSRLQAGDIDKLEFLLDDTPGLYEVTQLKRQPKDFKLGQIKREINRGQQIAPLYRLAHDLLPELQISNESITYYASLVGYYSVYKLKRLDRSVAYLYLLCFLFHRYQRLHDNLINCLIHDVKRYGDQAKAVAKERVYLDRFEGKRSLQCAAAVLRLFTDDTIAAETPFCEVQDRAFSILERRRLNAVADHISTKASFNETAFQWEYIDTLAHQIKRNLRPILLAVDFAAHSTCDPVIEASHFLKRAFTQRKPLWKYPQAAFPVAFIPETAQSYLYAPDGDQHQLLPCRYEFLVYRQLRNGLESGDIFCRDSVRFRSFEDDLIGDERWKQKKTLIEETGMSVLEQPIESHLAALEEHLEEQIAEVNRRIATGENDYIKVNNPCVRQRWKLTRPPAKEAVNHPVFDALSQVDISRVLHFVDRNSHFMDCLEHVRGRYVKGEASEQVIAACLVAWGTNMGLGRMGQISDIGYQQLATCSDNYIRLETLREATGRLLFNMLGAIAQFETEIRAERQMDGIEGTLKATERAVTDLFQDLTVMLRHHRLVDLTVLLEELERPVLVLRH